MVPVALFAVMALLQQPTICALRGMASIGAALAMSGQRLPVHHVTQPVTTFAGPVIATDTRHVSVCCCGVRLAGEATPPPSDHASLHIDLLMSVLPHAMPALVLAVGMVRTGLGNQSAIRTLPYPARSARLLF